MLGTVVRKSRVLGIVSALMMASALLLPGTASAQSYPVKFQTDGLWFLPLGKVESGSANASDKFGNGPGFGLALTGNPRERIHFGVRWDFMKSANDRAFTGFADPIGNITLGNPDGEKQRLTVMPVLAVLEYDWPINDDYDAFGEGGFGMVEFRQKTTLKAGSTELLTITGRQRNAAFSLALGATRRLGASFVLIGRLAYLQALGRDGEVYSKDDSPQFVSFSLGVRLK